MTQEDDELVMYNYLLAQQRGQWDWHNVHLIHSKLVEELEEFAAAARGQRIKSAIYSASPVLADGKIYVTNEDGLTTVVKAGPKFELLAENALNDYCLSSPAISQGQIFIRTAQHLYCIGKRSGQ